MFLMFLCIVMIVMYIDTYIFILFMAKEPTHKISKMYANLIYV